MHTHNMCPGLQLSWTRRSQGVTPIGAGLAPSLFELSLVLQRRLQSGSQLVACKAPPDGPAAAPAACSLMQCAVWHALSQLLLAAGVHAAC